MQRVSFIIAIALLVVLQTNAQQKNTLKVVNSFHISGEGGWDYLAVSPVHDWLYVSHGTAVNIINKKTGDSVALIDNTIGVHGIAFDPENGKGYISNGKLNNVFVFDINTNKVLTQIATGQNPDAILLEPFSKKLITCNGRSNNLSIIDPAQNKVIDSINVGGKPETAVSDGNGYLYVNIEDKNEIVKIDTRTFKVVEHWSLSPGEGPTGLAYDAKNKRLFTTCEKLLIVVNADNGKIVAKLPIGDGSDGVAFDSAKQNIYTSNGEGTVTTIHQDAAGKYTVQANTLTKRGARTITIDKQTGLLYLPTADYETTVSATQQKHKIKPNSFQVLVLGE